MEQVLEEKDHEQVVGWATAHHKTITGMKESIEVLVKVSEEAKDEAKVEDFVNPVFILF